MRSRDKVNTSDFHQQKTSGHQTRQGPDLQQEAPILKVIYTLDHVTNARSLENLKNFYFTVTRLMVSKHGRMLTYGRRFTTQALQSSPTSCFLFKLLLLLLLLLFLLLLLLPFFFFGNHSTNVNY